MGRGRVSAHNRTQTRKPQRTPQRATDDARDITEPDAADTQWQTRDAIRHILILFLVSRAILTVIGVLARKYIGPRYDVGDMQNFGVTTAGEIVILPRFERNGDGLEGIVQVGLGTGYSWLDIWGAWDTRWYITIAETWYNAAPDAHGYVPHAFLPLYPVLMKVFSLPFGNSWYGGVIVSNLALLAGAWLLYKLVYEMKDHETGKRAVLFMFLFPTAFMFSAILTEALFLALSIGAFYCARRQRWLVSCLLGGLSALTRLPGLFIGGLLFLEYMQQRRFRIRAVRADVLWLALVPLGTFLFMLAGYVATGSFFASFEAQARWGGRSFLNPITVLWHSVDGSVVGRKWFTTLGSWTFVPMSVFGAVLTIYVLAVLAWGYKQLGFHLLVWCALLILIPLSSSDEIAAAMPRYLVVVFPIFLVLARLRPGRVAYYTTAVVLALAQAFAMAFWTNNYQIL